MGVVQGLGLSLHLHKREGFSARWHLVHALHAHVIGFEGCLNPTIDILHGQDSFGGQLVVNLRHMNAISHSTPLALKIRSTPVCILRLMCKVQLLLTQLMSDPVL